MALVIEDGSIVPGANSYVTDNEFTSYAVARGYTLPTTPAEREILLIKSMDYLASLERAYLGTRVQSDQPLSFPRYNVVLNGYSLGSDEIPQELKNAQMELATQANTEDLLVNEQIGSANGNLASFNVQGVYSETYDSSKGVGTYTKTAKANAYLSMLTKSTRMTIRA